MFYPAQDWREPAFFWDFIMMLREQFWLTSVTRAFPRGKTKIVTHHLSLFIKDFLRFSRSDSMSHKGCRWPPPYMMALNFQGTKELGKSFPTRAPKAVVSTNTPWHLWDSPWSCLMSRHPLLSWSCCSGVSLSGSNQRSNSFIHHLPRLQTLSPNNRIFSYWKRASYKLYVHPLSSPALLFQDFFF